MFIFENHVFDLLKHFGILANQVVVLPMADMVWKPLLYKTVESQREVPLQCSDSRVRPTRSTWYGVERFAADPEPNGGLVLAGRWSAFLPSDSTETVPAT
jgi:hypothetical protein